MAIEGGINFCCVWGKFEGVCLKISSLSGRRSMKCKVVVNLWTLANHGDKCPETENFYCLCQDEQGRLALVNPVSYLPVGQHILYAHCEQCAVGIEPGAAQTRIGHPHPVAIVA